MQSIIYYILKLIYLYQIILVIYVICTWLVNLNILKTNKIFVQAFLNLLYKLCEPTLNVVQRYVPTIGNMDFSPVIVFLALEIFKQIIYY